MDRRNALKNSGLLAGTAIAMPGLLSLLQSCKSESRLGWQPSFFTEDEATTISMLVDMILPRTDTPGALDVNVDVFIDKVVAQSYTKKDQQKMRDDIAAFNEGCKTNFGKVFHELTEDKRIAVLQAAEKSNAKFNPGIWGKSIGEQESIGFYRSLKATAIWAYITSEEIGKTVLSYDPIPGKFQACIPVGDVGNKWTF